MRYKGIRSRNAARAGRRDEYRRLMGGRWGKFQVGDDPHREMMWVEGDRERWIEIEGYWWGGGRRRRNRMIQKMTDTGGAGRISC